MSQTQPNPVTPRAKRKVRFVAGLSVTLVVAAVTLFWFRWQVDPEASAARGFAALAKRDVPALHREIQILRRFPKYEPQVQLFRGMVFLAGNDLRSALHQFDLCSIHPATRVQALTLAGETFCKLDRQKEAMGVLQQAIGYDPQAVAAHRLLAVAYYDTGANFLAVEELRKVAELDPQDSRPHRLMGLIHLDHEQFAEAVQDYRACMRLSPTPETRKEVLLELSRALIKLHEYREALEFLEKAEPSADVWAYRAECHFSLGEKGKSRGDAMKAVELDPKHLYGLLWLGTLESESGNLPQAAKYLEQAVAAHPLDFTAPYKLAGIYQRQGRSEEAKAQLKRMEANRKLRERFTALHEQANEKPQDAQIRFELGETASQLQLFHLAKMWYQAALKLNPQHTRARLALSKLKVSDDEEKADAKLSSP